MPACNEDYIHLTVESALRSAKNPENIYFGIFEQRTDDKPFYKIDNIYQNKIKKISVRSGQPLGVGIARSNAMSLLRKQKYTLVIDSHTFFPENWDEKIIQKYKEVTEKIGDKTVFSQHLYSAKIENNEIKISDETMHPAPPIMKIKENIPYADSPSEDDWSEGFLESGILTCHFIFGHSSIFEELAFDSRIFYYFEEPLYSLRLCTRGYKIVSIDYNPLYHLNKGGYDVELSPNSKEWKRVLKYNFDSETYKKNFIAQKIAIDVFLGSYYGYWGAPDRQSLDDYLNKFNISVQNDKKELSISNVYD
jgi:hypothetical protein